MKTSHRMVLAAPLCAAILLAGCSAQESTGSGSAASDRVASTATPLPAVIIARSPVDQPGWAGLAVAWAPTVLVVDRNGSPVPNVTVAFGVAEGNGSVSQATAMTNRDGLASSSWILGATGGSNAVAATAQGLPGVSFRAIAKVPIVIARYKLAEIGGVPVPVSFAAGDGTTVITGGRYVLTTDNEFAFGYEVNGKDRVTPTGTFVQVDASTIKFFLSPGTYPASRFYAERDGLFATGHIEGKTMTMTYEDFVDFDTEKYVLSDGL